MKAIFSLRNKQKHSFLGFNLKNLKDLRQKYKQISEFEFENFPLFMLYDDINTDQPIIFCSNDKEELISFIEKEVKHRNINFTDIVMVFTLVWYESETKVEHFHLMSHILQGDWKKEINKYV